MSPAPPTQTLGGTPAPAMSNLADSDSVCSLQATMAGLGLHPPENTVLREKVTGISLYLQSMVWMLCGPAVSESLLCSQWGDSPAQEGRSPGNVSVQEL